MILDDVLARHDPVAVREAVPLMLLSALTADPTVQLPPPLVELLDAFLTRIGVTEAMPPADVERLVKEWTAAHPVLPALKVDLEQALRAVVTEAAAGGADAARVTGATTSKKPLGGGERPKDTVPAGPLARFVVAARDKPRK